MKQGSLDKFFGSPTKTHPKTKKTPQKPIDHIHAELIEQLKDEKWQKELALEFHKPYFLQLVKFLKSELDDLQTVYPPLPEVFHAFNATPFDKVKVVILGQDPYHGPKQAHGLAFSVLPGCSPPPSLRNIFKELHSDIGSEPPNHGYLEKWAQQGVFLLNTILTVRKGQAFSHKEKGWEQFTDAVIRKINADKEGVVFILWGKPAQEKEFLINTGKHKVLKAGHPSPRSVDAFLGNKHFSKTNQFLTKASMEPIDWDIPKMEEEAKSPIKTPSKSPKKTSSKEKADEPKSPSKEKAEELKSPEETLSKEKADEPKSPKKTPSKEKAAEPKSLTKTPSKEKAGKPKAAESGKNSTKKRKAEAVDKLKKNTCKRSKNAFFFFMQAVRGEVVKENPGKKSTEVSKIMGEKWKHMSKEEKEPFLKQAQEDKERIEQENLE